MNAAAFAQASGSERPSCVGAGLPELERLVEDRPADLGLGAACFRDGSQADLERLIGIFERVGKAAQGRASPAP